MESLFLLIPISLLLIGLLAWIFYWSVKAGQFDDLEGPGEAILMDDDTPKSKNISERTPN
jgi:cbb3-type cytochrome oxidase maturation protein